MEKNIIELSSGIAINNLKNIFVIQVIIACLSKKFTKNNLFNKPLLTCLYSFILQISTRTLLPNTFTSNILKQFTVPFFRTLIISHIHTKNVQIWLICDSISKMLYQTLHNLSFPYPSILLCCVASSEILTNWTLYSDKLSPSYKSFLDYQGMPHNNNALTILKNNHTHNQQTDKIQLKNAVMPNGHLWWIISHFITRSIPFYFSLNIIKSLISLNLKFKPFIIDLLTSSTFLTTYCYSAWISAIFTLNKSLFMYRTGLGISGISLFFIQNKTMRQTIGQYCFSMALYSYVKKIEHLQPINYLCGSLADMCKIRTLINML